MGIYDGINQLIELSLDDINIYVHIHIKEFYFTINVH